MNRRLLTFAYVAAAAGSTGSAQSFVHNTTDIPTGGQANASSTENVDFGDVDLDGDWDAVFADGGDAGNDQNRIWINEGGLQAGTVGVFSDETNARFPVLSDDSRDIEFVDFDADGDLDIYTSNTAQISNQGNRWWTNDGNGQGGTLGFYTDETASRWVGLNSASSSIPDSLLLPNAASPETFIDWSCDCDFGDLDMDGDMDLVHSTYGGAFGGEVPTRLFLNNGDGFFSEFNPSGFKLAQSEIQDGNPGLWCEGIQQSNTTVTTGGRCDVATSTLDIDVGDHDGDFDLDILHGDREEVPRMFTNMLDAGSLGFRDTTGLAYPAGYSDGTGHYEQEWADLDADGDLDIYGLNWQAGGFNFNDITLEGNGDGTFTSLATLSGSGSDDNEGDFLDYDNDGDLDLFVANFSGSNRLYENNNNGGGPGFSFTLVNGELPNVPSRISLDADAADVDADGDYDIFEANDNNAANRYFENVTQVPDTTPAHIPNVEQVVGSGAQSADDFVRAQVYDNAPYYITWYNETNIDVSVDGVALPAFPMVSSGGQIFRGAIPGNLVGSIEYSISSTDEHGNTGNSAPLNYTNTGSVGFTGGGSSPSSTGTAPILRSLARPLAGEPLYLLTENVAPGTSGVVFISDSQAGGLNLGDGVILNVGGSVVAPVFVTADSNGQALIAVSAVSPAAAGMTFLLQYFAADGLSDTWASSQRLGLIFP